MRQIHGEYARASTAINCICGLLRIAYRQRCFHLRRIIVGHCGDPAAPAETRYDPTWNLNERLVAELIHKSIGMESRLHELLVVDEAKASVKDRVCVSVLFKNVGKHPVGKRIHQPDALQIRLRDKGSGCQRVMRVIYGRWARIPFRKMNLRFRIVTVVDYLSKCSQIVAGRVDTSPEVLPLRVSRLVDGKILRIRMS